MTVSKELPNPKQYLSKLIEPYPLLRRRVLHPQRLETPPILGNFDALFTRYQSATLAGLKDDFRQTAHALVNEDGLPKEIAACSQILSTVSGDSPSRLTITRQIMTNIQNPLMVIAEKSSIDSLKSYKMSDEMSHGLRFVSFFDCASALYTVIRNLALAEKQRMDPQNDADLTTKPVAYFLNEDPSGLTIVTNTLNALRAHKENKLIPNFTYVHLIPELVDTGADFAEELYNTVYPLTEDLPKNNK